MGVKGGWGEPSKEAFYRIIWRDRRKWGGKGGEIDTGWDPFHTLFSLRQVRSLSFSLAVVVCTGTIEIAFCHPKIR